MLVLSRKVGERIRIAGDIVVVVTAIQGDRIKIGIEAPKSVRVLRGELQIGHAGVPNSGLAMGIAEREQEQEKQHQAAE